jgi:hypothetical protein
MAHFAQLNENNIVINVIAVHNNELLVDGIESETKGIEFCQSLFDGKWIQTSYNNNFRQRYAGVGFAYLPNKDIFIESCPNRGWVVDEELESWVPPFPKPDSGSWVWNNETINWQELDEQLP